MLRAAVTLDKASGYLHKRPLWRLGLLVYVLFVHLLWLLFLEHGEAELIVIDFFRQLVIQSSPNSEQSANSELKPLVAPRRECDWRKYRRCGEGSRVVNITGEYNLCN